MYSTSANPAEGNRSRESKTIAPFAPSAVGHPSIYRRATILVDKKSPLLAATPPNVIRALSYAHPFFSAANKFVALISWTSGDPYTSFLLLTLFWAVVLYADVVIRWMGPLLIVGGLILGMYLRRYSPLSSSGMSNAEFQSKHKRSFEDILLTIELLTYRCNILLDPFIRMTDFLSTQRTATSASTRPALTALLIRLFFLTPAWIVLCLPQVEIITTKRLVLVVGTIALTWHSRVACISRILLWRSRLVRRICAFLTGLHFDGSTAVRRKSHKPKSPSKDKRDANDTAMALLKKRHQGTLKPGVTFTFTVYENQRRWLGLGWTSMMFFPDERAAWTNELQNPSIPKEEYTLPEMKGNQGRWRWIDPDWWVDTSFFPKKKRGDRRVGDGWVYYDYKWQNPRYGFDSWGRYTRQRKWCRNAELVDWSDDDADHGNDAPADDSDNRTKPLADKDKGSDSSNPSAGESSAQPDFLQGRVSRSNDTDVDAAATSQPVQRGWFGRKKPQQQQQQQQHNRDDSASVVSNVSKDHLAPSWATSASSVSSAVEDEYNKYALPTATTAYDQLGGIPDELTMGLG